MHVHFHMQTDGWLNEKQNNDEDEDEEDIRKSEWERASLRLRKQISSAVREWPRSPISHCNEAHQLRLTTQAHTLSYKACSESRNQAPHGAVEFPFNFKRKRTIKKITTWKT